MAWNLTSDRPIYAQLVEIIQMQIVSGSYPPGAKLPTVRELAATAAVNPNTMQKAFSELERSGLIITQRTNGRNVTENQELIQNIRQKLAADYKADFFEKMQKLGFSEKDTAAFLEQSYGREKSE
ncbi:MAG: GntR family transcriptional regulator [Lachnoclostridium sp.]|nr:GntR family transcriptional regulator [Lachnospira sp.]MCM1247202.1 GntR family transcriptional regulator [Lachnoclostridium sp.]MCM1464780.1 GntR family transcriptional regulator [Bacteroidales bacterium]MCM1534577.1 GntR family transcriptional regulator [Clostridium sp.]MCM1326584.1 GntR family transcriptional regulator [Lachnoclostridium sp.]